MKKDLDRSKASFKLDLIETANADPMLSPYDFRLLAAYVAVMSWPACKAWLSPTLAMSMTGQSHGQFWKSRAVLLGQNPEGRAYLLEPRGSKSKASTYHVVNPWRDEAKAHIAAMTAYHKEAARKKKEKQRAKTSLHDMDGQETPCPSTSRSAVPPQRGDNTPLMITPRKREAAKKSERSAEVVNLSDRRRASGRDAT